MSETEGTVLQSAEVRRASRLHDYVELTKPRLTMLCVLTTLAGFYVASHGPLDVMLLIHTLLGTFMVGGGCGALNMYVEREHDVMMRRTMTRPLPSGRLTANDALLFGLVLGLGGILYLSLAVNLLTGGIGALTLASYVLLYTPMKRRTTLNTIIGGLPGALPPVMGWTAVHGSIGLEAAILFAILFFWQMPHFLALGWMYRNDYARAGYKMLTVIDPECRATSRQILLYTTGLLPVSLLPTIFHVSGIFYFFGALVLGLGFIALGGMLAVTRKNKHARYLFHFSLLYLPILLLVMAIDRM